MDFRKLLEKSYENSVKHYSYSFLNAGEIGGTLVLRIGPPTPPHLKKRKS